MAQAVQVYRSKVVVVVVVYLQYRTEQLSIVYSNVELTLICGASDWLGRRMNYSARRVRGLFFGLATASTFDLSYSQDRSQPKLESQ